MDKEIFRRINEQTFEIIVQLSPGAKKEQILGISDEKIFGKDIKVLKVSVREKPTDNKANIALIEFLAKTLKIAKTKIHIKSGVKSKRKILIISENL